MDLRILEHRVRVLSIARGGLWLYTHPLFKMLLLPQRSRCKFFSLTETPEDYTVILDEEGFKELPPSEFLQVVDSTWLVLNVLSNGRSSANSQPIGVTKIAKSVIAPLAEHNVSVLMLSTYQTDFILVREKDLPIVIHTLEGEFEIYKEVNGEPVPANCDEASNGFLKPKQTVNSTVHPIQSPQNRFCILSVAPDSLPAIATILIDVLFYSHSTPKETVPSSQDLNSIAFFAFSLIEGYISIVMDAETKKKSLGKDPLLDVPALPVGSRGACDQESFVLKLDEIQAHLQEMKKQLVDVLGKPGAQSNPFQAFYFPLENVGSYVEVRPLLEMNFNAFTLCFWSQNHNQGTQTVLHYSTQERDKELVATVGSVVGVWIGGQSLQFHLPRESTDWVHHCITWNSHSGIVNLWVNGAEGTGKNIEKGYVIQKGGTVMLGKEKNMLLDVFSNGFAGWLSHLNLWNRILDQADIQKLTLCKIGGEKGNVIAWGETPMTVYGGVVLDTSSRCK